MTSSHLLVQQAGRPGGPCCPANVHVFTGAGAVHVLPEQGLPQDHLPQLAARLQRGADHVLLAGGMATTDLAQPHTAAAAALLSISIAF